MVCYLSLGTNLGDRESNLRRAVSLINKRAGRVLRQSHFLETDPQGFVSENKFLNACIALDTDLPPGELLAATQAIEREMGRTQKSAGGNYSDRIIDIDILLYGNEHIRRDDLEVPHPRMREREFVMRPLKEILK
ncbi:MAG: 2-amino-4-hydroxy-6-hydroxymethyldihydropteridine diphosphokinase [Prevotella sp.]|nr:2-amino-4-hydroxy-6-hydroxymethyldihydropteridine diphosphokinase [Prevotella sp.]